MIEPEKDILHMQAIINMSHTQIGILADPIIIMGRKIAHIYGSNLDLNGIMLFVHIKIHLYVNE